jgi:hypothetical protein
VDPAFTITLAGAAGVGTKMTLVGRLRVRMDGPLSRLAGSPIGSAHGHRFHVGANVKVRGSDRT